jgi:branched-chain amino acid transport system permease protein
MRSRAVTLRTVLIIAAVFTAWLGAGLLVTNSYYRLVLTLVPIWAVLAISWNLLSGYSGLISFGHAAFFGLGAFTVGLGMKLFSLTPWFGIPLATCVGALAGAAVGFPTFRLRGTYFALAMLAYPLAFIAAFEWLGLQELAMPMRRDAPLWFAQFADFRAYLVMALVLLAIATLVSLRVEGSRFGLSLLAIKQNELAAEAAGIDTFRWKMRAMVLSAALAATAGALYMMVVLVITPASVFGVVVSAQAMVLTLFGGAGTFWGPLIGSAVLVPLSEFLNAELGQVLPGIQGLVYGLAIIFVVLLAPEGIYWRLHDVFSRRPEDRRQAAPQVMAPSVASVPRPACGPVLLAVRGICKAYGGLRAVQDVSFDVREGEIVGIIGPNGAGKTTLFNLLNGVVRPDQGTVVFAGNDITGRKPSQVCNSGIGRTFQVARAFTRMTVLQNVVTGAFVAHARDDDAWQAARDAVAGVGLADRAETLAGNLTSRELRLLELARALSSNPRLVLLDEPLAGLGSTETQEMIGLIRSLPARGITVVIIEHTMQAMVSTVDRFVVLDHGALLTSGDPGEVTRDPRVIEAYLGRKWAGANAAA